MTTNIVTISVTVSGKRDNVIPLDPVERARGYVENWRKQTVQELVRRCQLLMMIEHCGTRLPTDVYNAYLCMRAVVEVAGRR